mmetsp:Transcript_63464/g.148673  ORF Transcript_63464/g.148673 Transcript_63464/m.148673 type:complete len:205 (-) Transcript_63464:302-916(-)
MVRISPQDPKCSSSSALVVDFGKPFTTTRNSRFAFSFSSCCCFVAACLCICFSSARLLSYFLTTSLFPPRLVPFSFRALLAVLISVNSTMAKPRAAPFDFADLELGTVKLATSPHFLERCCFSASAASASVPKPVMKSFAAFASLEGTSECFGLEGSSLTPASRTVILESSKSPSSARAAFAALDSAKPTKAMRFLFLRRSGGI